MANGVAIRSAITAVMTEPTSIAPMPNDAVALSIPSPASHLTFVINPKPKSRKISKPRNNKNAPISARTINDIIAPPVMTPRKTLSEGPYSVAITRPTGLSGEASETSCVGTGYIVAEVGVCYPDGK